jgi:hypothetical protein
MFARTLCLTLVVAVCAVNHGLGQATAPPDLRVLSLRSLQAGRTVRISGRDVGTITGSVDSVHDGALWLVEGAGRRRVSVTDIDSVWVSKGHAATGAVAGGLIGLLVGAATISGRRCELGDSGCIAGASAEATGIMLAGALLGALIGGASRSWQLRYP